MFKVDYPLKGSIILAGGLSRRMGRPKPLLDFGGKPLIVRIVNRLRETVEEIVVVLSKRENVEIYRAILPSYVTIAMDLQEEQAPLVGVYSGLRAIQSEWAFIVSCDVPFLNQKVVELLFEKTKGYDAAVPIWPNGLLEPLHAVYSVKPSLRAASIAVKNGRFKNIVILKDLQVNYIPIDFFKSVDSRFLSFLNVNTQNEYQEALKLID
jgi:molybdopterin-guanine dinucleotide biosynthesis protein A